MTEERERKFLAEMDREVHDLCQPLTALQCRLELGQMIGEPEALMEAVQEALGESRRLFAAVNSIQGRLQREMERER